MNGVGNLPMLIQRMIMKKSDVRTQVFISMSYDDSGWMRGLLLPNSPGICVHYDGTNLTVVLDENRDNDQRRRFQEPPAMRPHNQQLMIVNGEEVVGYLCNEVASSRFLIIPTPDSALLLKLREHFARIYGDNVKWHLRINVENFNLRTFRQRMPVMEFSSISIKSETVRLHSLDTIINRGGHPDFVHLDVQLLTGQHRFLPIESDWRNKVTHLENGNLPGLYWQSGTQFIVYQRCQLPAEEILNFVSRYLRSSEANFKFLAIEMAPHLQPLEMNAVLIPGGMFGRGFDFDGFSRPVVFEVPRKEANCIPRRFRSVDLRDGRDLIRHDGTRVTMLTRGQCFYFAVWQM